MNGIDPLPAKGRSHLPSAQVDDMTRRERLEKMLAKYYEQDEKHMGAGRLTEAKKMREAIIRTQHALDSLPA